MPDFPVEKICVSDPSELTRLWEHRLLDFGWTYEKLGRELGGISANAAHKRVKNPSGILAILQLCRVLKFGPVVFETRARR